MSQEAKGPSGPKLVRVPDELPLSRELLVSMHDLMVKARALEERLIAMYKSGHGYFWIGGPGEEAFNVPLGLLIKKGQGLDYDYLHAHYRQSATLLAMGEDPVGALRQMKNTASDPYSGGRNFAGHYSIRRWNVVPVTSTIEVQYVMAPGTALAQKRHGGDGITIVTGGDAGTAEGDFASCLLWATRPGNELPLLIIVTNNLWGISTPASSIHAPKNLSDRGKAFGMRTKTIDGRGPFLLEAMVSRLHGHSSASGANLVTDEEDCLRSYEARLERDGVLSRDQMNEVRTRYAADLARAARQVIEEPQPEAKSIWEHVFADNKGQL